jgi:hypothetical protein
MLLFWKKKVPYRCQGTIDSIVYHRPEWISNRNLETNTNTIIKNKPKPEVVFFDARGGVTGVYRWHLFCH